MSLQAAGEHPWDLVSESTLQEAAGEHVMLLSRRQNYTHSENFAAKCTPGRKKAGVRDTKPIAKICNLQYPETAYSAALLSEASAASEQY